MCVCVCVKGAREGCEGSERGGYKHVGHTCGAHWLRLCVLYGVRVRVWGTSVCACGSSLCVRVPVKISGELRIQVDLLTAGAEACQDI